MKRQNLDKAKKMMVMHSCDYLIDPYSLEDNPKNREVVEYLRTLDPGHPIFKIIWEESKATEDDPEMDLDIIVAKMIKGLVWMPYGPEEAVKELLLAVHGINEN